MHRQGSKNTQLKCLLNIGKHFVTFKRFANTAKNSLNFFDSLNLNCSFLLIKYVLIL